MLFLTITAQMYTHKEKKEKSLGRWTQFDTRSIRSCTLDNIKQNVYSFELLNKPSKRKGVSVDLDEC